MSSPGFFMDDADYARQQMARSLMQPQSAQGSYGGIANAGGQLLGAMAQHNMQNQMQQKMQNAMTPTYSADTGFGTLNSQAPSLPSSSGSFMSRLFSMGG